VVAVDQKRLVGVVTAVVPAHDDVEVVGVHVAEGESRPVKGSGEQVPACGCGTRPRKVPPTLSGCNPTGGSRVTRGRRE
jgi:hypothetical protein